MIPSAPSAWELYQRQAEHMQQFTIHSSGSLVAQSFAELRQLLARLTSQPKPFDPVTQQDWHSLGNYTLALTLLNTFAREDLRAFLQGDPFALLPLQEKVAQTVQLLAENNDCF